MWTQNEEIVTVVIELPPMRTPLLLWCGFSSLFCRILNGNNLLRFRFLHGRGLLLL